MSDPEHTEFDLSTIVDSLQRGRDELLARRASIVGRQVWFVTELARIDTDLERIGLMLPAGSVPTSAEPKPGPEHKPRQVGVQRLVEQCVRDLPSPGAVFSLNAIVTRLVSAGASPERSSVLSALNRLVEQGLVARITAARGRNPEYKLTNVATLGIVTAQNRPGPDDAPVVTALSIPPTTNSVCELVVALLRTAGQDGMARVELAWRLDDASLLDDALADPRIMEASAPGMFKLRPEQVELPLT